MIVIMMMTMMRMMIRMIMIATEVGGAESDDEIRELKRRCG